MAGALVHAKSDDPGARQINPIVSVLKNEAAHKDWIYVGQHSSASVPTARFRNANTSGESLVAYAQNASTKILAASNTGVTMAGTLTVTGALAANGGITTTTLTASGLAEVGSLEVNGDASIDGSAVVNVDLAVDGNLDVDGDSDQQLVRLTPDPAAEPQLLFRANVSRTYWGLGASDAANPNFHLFTLDGSLVATEQFEITETGRVNAKSVEVYAGDLLVSGSGRLAIGATTFSGAEELRVVGQTRLEGQVTVTTGGVSVTGSSAFGAITVVGTASFTGDFSVQVGANTMLDIRSAGVGFNGKAGQAPPNYTLTNYTSDRRTLDMTSGTAAEVREFLCTLANDLIDKTGILS